LLTNGPNKLEYFVLTSIPGARVIKPITDVIKDFLTVKRLLRVIKLNLRYNLSSYGEITVLQKY